MDKKVRGLVALKKSEFVTLFSVSFLALTFFTTFSIPNASAFDTEMIPTGGSGWVGVTDHGATPLSGTMPFGNQLFLEAHTCDAASYAYNTLWLGNPDVPLIGTSHTFTLPAGTTTDVMVNVAIDNDVKVLINGHDITPTQEGGVAPADSPNTDLAKHDGCAIHYNAVFHTVILCFHSLMQFASS